MPPFICVICDGLPDRPLRELGNRTPLEVAATPNLDRIATDGISGTMHPVDVGVRPGSDTAHLAIFGYDPQVYYTGRGPFECAGIGMELLPGDVALRANAATLDASGVVIDRRAGRLATTQPLVEAIGQVAIAGVKAILQPSLGHRLGLVLRGDRLSPKVSDQDPHVTGGAPLAVRPLDASPEARRTADVLNALTAEVRARLADCPVNRERVRRGLPAANTILFRGAGTVPDNLVPFPARYGISAAFIAGAPMYRGLARIIGMDVITFNADDGVTGLPDSNLERKFERALRVAERYDSVFVHVKAADSLAEDGNVAGKIAFIEKIDRALSPVVAWRDGLVVVTADHTTASQLKRHTADPVPIVIRGEGVHTDEITAFSERSCVRGGLGRIRGIHLMPILLDLLGRSPLYGA